MVESLGSNPDSWDRTEQFLKEAILTKGGPISLGEMLGYAKSCGYVPENVETPSEFLRLFDVNHYVRKRRKETDIRFTDSGFKWPDVYSFPSLILLHQRRETDVMVSEKIDVPVIEILLVE